MVFRLKITYFMIKKLSNMFKKIFFVENIELLLFESCFFKRELLQKVNVSVKTSVFF